MITWGGLKLWDVCNAGRAKQKHQSNETGLVLDCSGCKRDNCKFSNRDSKIENMNLKFKKLHPDAVLPKHSRQGDAGMDLTVVRTELIYSDSHEIPTKQQHYFGLSVEIPEGNVGLIFPRSSIHKQSNRLSNSVGVIDSGYRGELMAIFDLSQTGMFYISGERSAQLVIIPYVSCVTEWAEELSETERGANGYGSTGS